MTSEDKPEILDDLLLVVGIFQTMSGTVTILQCKDCKIVCLKIGS